MSSTLRATTTNTTLSSTKLASTAAEPTLRLIEGDAPVDTHDVGANRVHGMQHLSRPDAEVHLGHVVTAKVVEHPA